jgi:predicted heme/steroid binding protein
MKSWRDVQEAAVFCPYLHAAVTRVRIHDVSQEQALRDVAIDLSEALRQQTAMTADLMKRLPSVGEIKSPHDAR